MSFPVQANPYELIILMERAPIFSGIEKPKGSKWHGHSSVLLRGKYFSNRGDEIMSFEGPASWNEKKKYVGPVRALVWDLWQVGKGEITTESFRADCWHVFPLTRANFVKAYEKIMDYTSGKNYQMIGFKADNCVGFTRSVMEAAGIKTPLSMKLVPWPISVRHYIRKLEHKTP